jgi:hypothetical protein
VNNLSAIDRKGLTVRALALSLLGYAWLAWSFLSRSAHTGTPEVCMFRALTHLPCPSCGATRASVLLIEGKAGESFMMNPLGFLIVAGLLVVPLWLIVDRIRGTDSFPRRYAASENLLRRNVWLTATAIMLVAANWAWNIFKGL